jgi:5-methylcytosine-specific restriction protein A
MESFLITFKPASENPKRGWPLGELQGLVRRLSNGDEVQEKWRFQNRKDAAIGDRVFVLLQGRGGPAIIGYGRITGEPENDGGRWVTPVTFESLVDPSTAILASKDQLLTIEGGERFWRIQSSGVLLDKKVAASLEGLVVGKAPVPVTQQTASNPDWTRDELIVALAVYLKHRTSPPAKSGKEIGDLSRALNRLGDVLFSPQNRAETFRNENGVYMKLMNFRRLDPQYTAGGRTGLPRGAKAEKDVWNEFASDPDRCETVANAILANLEHSEVGTLWLQDDIDAGLEEASEGRILTRSHLIRERNRKLVAAKRKQVLKQYGKLGCEVCSFDFSVQYGEHGNGFIECHHIKPVASLVPGDKTHIDDLALVCANCHRMIHRRKPWLSIAELKACIAPRD